MAESETYSLEKVFSKELSTVKQVKVSKNLSKLKNFNSRNLKNSNSKVSKNSQKSLKKGRNKDAQIIPKIQNGNFTPFKTPKGSNFMEFDSFGSDKFLLPRGKKLNLHGVNEQTELFLTNETTSQKKRIIRKSN